MANVPLRPAGANFYGVFLMPIGPTASWTYHWEHWSFATSWKLQIDAAEAAGANTIFFMGDFGWIADGSGISQNTYLGYWKEILDYIAKVGMFCLPYIGEQQGAYWGTATQAQVITVMVAVAQLCAKYPNVIGLVSTDEPIDNETDDATAFANCAAFYSALKAVVPSDIGICTAPNPCGNSAVPVFKYTNVTNANKDKCDGVAAYNDFFAFHPFNTIALSDSTLVRAAYPGKEIIMPSSMNSNEGDSDIATKCASIMGLVGSNGFRGMGWWGAVDIPIGAPTATIGLVNSDYTTRATKVGAFQAGIVGTYPTRIRRRFYGSPRINQALRWGYQ